jgi:hypothetical protein
MRNEETLHRVNEKRNNVHAMKRRKTNWIGHSWRRNWLIKHVVEGRRRKKLSDELEEKRRYGNLKAEALDLIVWRSRFGGR